MSDLFAPPSPEEIANAKSQQDLFAPPSADELAAAKQSPYTPLESAGMGLAEGASMGFAPAIGGASATALQATKNLVSGEPDKQPLLDKYRQNRDYISHQMETAHKQNPKSYTAGEVGGSLGTALIPGVGEIGAMKSLGPIAQTAVKGGIQGGLVGLGTSKADLTKGELPEAAYDTAKGAMLGGTIGGVTGAVAPIAANKLSQIAEQRAFKAATGQKIKVLRDAVKTGKVDIGENGKITSTMGRDLLTTDEAGGPVITPFSKSSHIAASANEKAGHFGAKIGQVADEIDKSMPEAVSGDNISKKILDYIVEEVPDNPANNAVRNKLLEEAQFYQSKGHMSFGDAQRFKNTYNFKPTDTTTQVLGQDATNAIKRSIGHEMDETADLMSKAASSNSAPESQRLADLLDKYQQYKQKYGSYATAAKAAEDQSLRQLSNRYVSPSDYGTGIGGALAASVAHQSPEVAAGIGLASAGANKILRERGSSMAARGSNSLAEALSGNPAAFGPYAAPLLQAMQKGNSNLALTHYLLMKNDPRYREMINNQGQ